MFGPFVISAAAAVLLHLVASQLVTSQVEILSNKDNQISVLLLSLRMSVVDDVTHGAKLLLV